MPSPLLTVQNDHAFRNKHENVALAVGTFYDVHNLWADAPAPARNDWRPGLQGLRAIVAEAERTGKSVRALGGAWSLSEAAINRQIMVNTKNLNFIELGFRSENLDPAFTGDRSALCFAQCGASVMELYQYLEPRGFTLPTGGASNGQTIAGAVSTGTHGAAHAVGAMQDFILGLHVVIDGGRHVWIERKSRPAVSAAFCQALNAELRRADDELFEAAIVSFGSFGVIHAVLFEAEPLYLLERTVIRRDYTDVRKTLNTFDMTPLGFSDVPFHYEIILDPYHTGAGERGAYVRSMRKLPFHAAPAERASRIVPGDDAMGFLGSVTNVAPEVVPLIIAHVLSLKVPEVQGVLGTPGQQFGPTDSRGFIISIEIGVAQCDAEKAVDAVITVAREFPWAGFPAIRFVKASTATLAFTHFAPVTCTIEVPSAGSDRTKAAFERIWVELHRRNIVFTLHWGQCLRPAAVHFPTAYGNRVSRWQAARRALLGDTGQRLFNSDWLVKLSLG